MESTLRPVFIIHHLINNHDFVDLSLFVNLYLLYLTKNIDSNILITVHEEKIVIN